MTVSGGSLTLADAGRVVCTFAIAGGLPQKYKHISLESLSLTLKKIDHSIPSKPTSPVYLRTHLGVIAYGSEAFG